MGLCLTPSYSHPYDEPYFTLVDRWKWLDLGRWLNACCVDFVGDHPDPFRGASFGVQG